MNVLRDPAVMMECNIYSIIFDYKDNCFYLSSGTVPAATDKYRKFILFEKTE